VKSFLAVVKDKLYYCSAELCHPVPEKKEGVEGGEDEAADTEAEASDPSDVPTVQSSQYPIVAVLDCNTLKV